MSYDEHKFLVKNHKLKAGVITLSDTRTKQTDKSGRIIIDLLGRVGGHEVCYYELVKETPKNIKVVFENALAVKDIDLIVSTGGTGLSARDQTIETVTKFFDKEISGFGELFRMISYQQIGPAAMLSRATAGIVNQTLLVCLPGSSKAVKLAMERLVMPEASHILREARR